MNRPGVLLDRDGTVIADTGYVGSVDRVEFLDGAIEAIAALNRAGLPVAVVTNQAGVARGFYGIEDVHQVHKHMIEEMARHGAHVDLWLFCPYHPDGIVESFARSSADRKPGPGMALAAAEELGLDLASSWVVGDSASDMGLARAVGATPLHVGAAAFPASDIMSFPDLAAAAEHILRHHVGGVPGPARRSRTTSTPTADRSAAPTRTSSPGPSARSTCCRSPEPPRCSATPTARGASVFACGNGGSASIANHLQCDHVKGIRNGTDLRTRALSLSTNIELFSAIANDLGYDNVFEYQLESLAQRGDVLLAVSSSGRSPNIVRALEWANRHAVETVAFTGFSGGAAKELAPSPCTSRRATTGWSRTRTRPSCICSPSTSGSRG